MKKILLLLAMALGFGFAGIGQAILYEDFNYTPPTSVGGSGAAGTSQNNWTIHSGSGSAIEVLSGNLSYTGLAPSGGYKVYIPGANSTCSRDINRTISSSSTVLYYSALVNVIDATQLSATDFNYFLHFGAQAGASVTTHGGRLGIKSVNTGANFRLGILNQSSPSPAVAVYSEYTTDLSFGVTYLVVVKYDRSTTPTTAYLWVNPASLGGSEPSGQITCNSGTNTFATFASVCIRNAVGTPKADIDEIRVGTTWADVTPTGSISAPTVQTSGFTFSNVLQTQMDVSWTNGDGAKRVVKINTTNSFSPPADGTDPTASSIYTGGEQVIYNGSGSTIPIVTGLTSATTYWFQAWEYNGSETGTMYCTASGTNNPLSQATAAAATPPVVASPTATAITATGATLGGNITADGGAAITERGTVWSTVSPVTIADNKGIEGGTATGIFSHARTGMPNNTLIYYAAYAVNSAGTTLSTEASFTTLLGEPTNHADSFAAAAPTYSTVTTTWADNDGTQPATGFLILGNITGTFTDPVDGVPVTNDANLNDGSGAMNISHGVKTYTWTGLTSSTQYFFKIYAYTNSGSNIDYKLLPSAPEASVTTPVFLLPVAAWTFDTTLVSPTNMSTALASNVGDQAGSAMFYANGTNGSSSWTTGTEVTAFAGTTLNDPREGTAAVAGNAYTPLGGTGLSSNGKAMVIKYSMSALQDPILTFATRATSTGFKTHQWAWSVDGTNFTDFGTNTATTSTSYVSRTLDMSAINALDGSPEVYLRVTFSGATNATGNNRLDNIVISADAATNIPPTVFTTAATNVDVTTATLNGTVNANNQESTVKFAWGLTTAYGDTLTATPATVNGGSVTPASAGLTGLSMNTTYYYKILATNASGASAGSDMSFTTACQLPDAAGDVSGPLSVCADGVTAYEFTVPPINMATSYVWTVPAGAEIISGDGTNTISVAFIPSGITGDISVFGSNVCGDGDASAPLTITLNQPLVAGISIVASANPVATGTTVTFTATPVNGGTAPSYQWLVNGLFVGSDSPVFSYVPLNNDVVECDLISSEGCVTNNPATSNAITMTVTGPPADRTVDGTVPNGIMICYDATNTITVAGVTAFTVETGGSATFIAGSMITFLPGTTVQAGGYMQAYIAPAGPWCTTTPAPEVIAGSNEVSTMALDNSYRIYPNPTSGNFTIESLGARSDEAVKVEIYGTLGDKVMQAIYPELVKQELSLAGNPAGVYFVKITSGNNTQTVKMILTR